MGNFLSRSVLQLSAVQCRDESGLLLGSVAGKRRNAAAAMAGKLIVMPHSFFTYLHLAQPHLTDLQTLLNMIETFVTAGAIVVTAVYASRGLNTWREQMHATADIDLAKRINAAVIELRNALIAARYPFSVTNKVDAVDRFRRGSERVRDARKSLEYESREEELLWGAIPKALTDTLLGIAMDYEIDVGKYILETTTDESKETLIQALRPKSDSKDQFDLDLKDAVSGIQEYLLPKMHRKKQCPITRCKFL